MNLRQSIGFAALTSLLWSPMAAAEIQKDGLPRYVETELVPEFNSITLGQPFAFAVTQKHTEGWHTYWKNPGDSGESTSIAWTLPEGFKAEEILYPAPERQATGPLMNFGFGGNVTLLTSIDVPEKFSGTHVEITADISWLVCSDICIPEMKQVKIDLPITQNGEAVSPTDPELFKAARASLPLAKAWQGRIEEMDQVLALDFMMGVDEAARLEGASDFFFYPEEWGIILNATPQDITVQDNHLIIKAQRDSRLLSEIQSLHGVLTYQDSAGQHQAVALSVPVTAQNSSAAMMTGTPENAGALPPSFLQAVFLALLGGLILNLMPCVFPVLSLKALSLVKMSEKEQKHSNLHGVFYTLGVLACFGAIAGTLIFLQQAGEEIGWGFQLQNPVVVLLLAYLLFAMALNLSGFFEMRGHLFTNIGHKLTARHGYSGTFFTGVLATIVATPCTAPFMATAMGYALTQPPVVALSVFMALGFGLALPYVLLCFIPPLRKALPKPGKWMETFRQFMSFPLFASVAWLIWVYAQQVDGEYGTLLGLSGLVLIAFSIWVARHEPRRQPMKTAIHAFSISSLVLAFVIAGLSQTGMHVSQSASQEQSLPSIPFNKSSFDELIAGNDPVFVDMTASWCITCQVNERIALYTRSTEDLFQSRNVQYVVGDWTNRNPEITAFLKEYGRNGVPLYVYYGPRDQTTGQRPEPKILPQLLTSGLVADVINGGE